MIDLKLLSQKRPFVYHLTSNSNLPSILSSKALLSASVLLEQADKTGLKSHLRVRRANHLPIEIKGRTLLIRDQRPLSERALQKCLDAGLTFEDYYELLNNRVFLWATVSRLCRHYDRYRSEDPVLLRFRTAELLRLNPNAEFSRINSGATRANSHLGGIAPRRGRETFQIAANCAYGIASIVEVTVRQKCMLPERFELGSNPEGPWNEIRTKQSGMREWR
jgi:hypothetical protein